jgi:hypothetical protein
MKKALLFVSLFTLGSTFAQDCSKLFISEYVEGWSNNKAIEIYNPTNAPIDLSEYIIARYSNGVNSAAVENAVQLSGTVAARDVFVAVLDKRNPAGIDQEAPIWDSLEVKGDGFFCPIYNTSDAFYWNGNDAIVLFKGTLTGSSTTQLSTIIPALIPIDIFGKVGQNPGSGSDPIDGWTAEPPYTSPGTSLTVDHSLIRKSTVLKGVSSFAITEFNALAEYDSIPATTYLFDANGDTIKSAAGNPIQFGNWESLGTHDCACNFVSVNKIPELNQFSVYPNPSADGTFNIAASAGIEKIIVLNSLGQTVKTIKVNANNTVINIGDAPGVYIFKVETGNGIVTKRVIVK